MRLVRIALADLPEHLRRLVEEGLADQPDLAVVAVTSSGVDVLLEAARVDVVVVAAPGGRMPAVAERLLDEYPSLGVVGLDPAGGPVVVHRLRPDAERVDGGSPHAIVAAIRRAAEDTAAWGHR